MAGCMISVFAALGEFVIVKVLHGKYNAMKAKEAKLAKVSIIYKTHILHGVLFLITVT